ncbi:hypothetical protein Q1695_011695 [Nippostrongylus brasiliensis]|nr:hypothetical protein Q1695_011695 [Nippostrongylus brasiliensis]
MNSDKENRTPKANEAKRRPSMQSPYSSATPTVLYVGPKEICEMKIQRVTADGIEETLASLLDLVKRRIRTTDRDELRFQRIEVEIRERLLAQDGRLEFHYATAAKVTELRTAIEEPIKFMRLLEKEVFKDSRDKLLQTIDERKSVDRIKFLQASLYKFYNVPHTLRDALWRRVKSSLNSKARKRRRDQRNQVGQREADEKTDPVEMTFLTEATVSQAMPMDHSVDRVRLIVICLALSFCVNYQYAFSSTYTNSAVHSLQRFVEGSNTTESSDSTGHKFSWLWSILVSIWFVGFLPGIWASNWLIERFGRRAAFLIGNILNVVGSVLRCLAILIDEVYILVGARVLCGFGTAMSYCALVLYLQEVAPSSLRGMTSCLNGVVYALVALFGITLGNDVFLGKHLLLYLLSAVPPCAIGVILLAILPETPKYLVLQGEYQKAQLSLRFYHGGSSPISDSIKSIERDIGRASEDNGKLSEIFAVPQLRASLKLFLAALQNTAALWTILFSSTFYLERADVEHRVAQWSSAIMAGSYVLGTITGAVLIERQETDLNFLHECCVPA